MEAISGHRFAYSPDNLHFALLRFPCYLYSTDC